ncbi:MULTISPECIES: [protein-PII] uridylyltransferase [Asticcacaulis]|uniref:[protein-PII] uridylyltransferase n=1 Tax=Asticcacaulis TaxID=76890 RepID=UPI001FDA694E|nr:MULTISPECIES: [protein-PII] uridylyltransferase [Asticcacaulis]MBP2159836.1 [protein-PII] uridylyltransferase [Asticcacaulis solisilvae]MDR6800881.1 [protein-PII] uridylyltransferase [Asticcacaulis sp. BE141]
MDDASDMLTATQSPAPAYRIDGARLRQALTDTYEDSTGDSSDLRRRAVKILKEALQLSRAAILDNIDHKGGHATARALARATDEIVSALWDFTLTHVYRARNPTEGERLSLLAVGGYGRGELAPHSDLDLLFLRAWKETSHSESVIEFILYTLWDLGLKVGHASRTVEETIKYARGDHTIMTALLEHRQIAGDKELVELLDLKLATEGLKTNMFDFVAAKLEERDARHFKAGATRFVVEPNLKEGKGGLRDLHTLFWIAKYRASAEPNQSAQIIDETAPRKSKDSWGVLDRILTDRERQIFMRAFDFLWKVRILIHVTAGRGEERLSFDLQPEIARRMGFIDRQGEPNVERFMRRYFIVSKEVGALTRAFCTKLEAQDAKPLTRLSNMIQSGLMNLTKADHPGFVVTSGRLSVNSPDIFQKSPVAMFLLFKMADRLELDLHPDAFTAIARNLTLVTPSLRRDPKAARLFLDLLVRGRNPYRILSLMSETGLLGRYIPEFGRIVAQTQFNMYHAYTVDEHTLRAIDIIHGVDTGRYKADHPLATAIMPQLVDKESLYLAMLLHDTGKGGEDGQEIGGERAARKACERLGLEPWKIDQIAWLVRHHLVLSDYAQKRDVSDPETVASFARIVETPERLRLLLILTVADIRAVGPGVWNAWKGQLMRDLFAATESAFRGGRGSDAVASVREGLNERAEARREELSQDNDDMAAWLATMDENYLFSFTPEDIRSHADLVLSSFNAEAAVRARIDESRNATAFSISASDRQGLFADLSRTFANLGANVVGAQVFTSSEGNALDVFYVQDTQGLPFAHDDPQRLKQAEKQLEQAALGQLPPAVNYRSAMAARTAAFAIAPTVAFDDTANAGATILEVSGRDRPGLLADLVEALARLHMDIASAHIDCYGERAVDAFYVTDHFKKAQLTAGQKQAVRKALLTVLDQPAAAKENITRARASLAR